ncbi:MAG: tetratricopeptide repeat protein [Kiritimatiellae bacterium]|nr:tetratricopeptide repeat protein [Kiritimatiellia bacterium]
MMSRNYTTVNSIAVKKHIQSIVCVLILLTASITLTGCSGEPQVDFNDLPPQELTDGMIELRERNYANALPLLEIAVQKRPQSPSAHCNLGIALWKMNHLVRASKAFETSALLNGNDARPLEFLAQVLMESGNLEEARKVLLEAHERTPHSPRILTSLAVAEIQCGKTNLTYLIEAMKLKPGYAPALYNMALVYRDQANKQKCANLCKAYLDAMDSQTRIPDEQDNQRTIFITELHNAMQNKNQAPVKIPVKTPMEEIDPFLVKARKAIDNESYGTALVLLKQAIKKSPKNADLLWELALVYDKRLKYKDRAMRTYNQFMKQFPSDSRIRAIPEYKKEKTSRPLKKPPITTVKPIKTRPAISTPKTATLFAHGVNAHKKGDISKATDLYKRVLEIDKTHAVAAYNLGLIYYNSGKDVDKARDAFLLTLAHKPDMASARYMLGVVYKLLDDNNNALEQLNKALRIKPNHARAHFVLGLIYHSEKHFDVARLHLNRYLQFAPKGTYALRVKQLLSNIEKELSGDAHKPPMPR